MISEFPIYNVVADNMIIFCNQRSLGERLYDASFEGDVNRMKVFLEKAKTEDLNWQNAHGASVMFVAAQQVRFICLMHFKIVDFYFG